MATSSFLTIAATFAKTHFVGTGTVFLLPAQPVANSMLLFCNGLFLTEGVDYTLSNTIVTLQHRTISSSDVLTAFYVH